MCDVADFVILVLGTDPITKRFVSTFNQFIVLWAMPRNQAISDKSIFRTQYLNA